MVVVLLSSCGVVPSNAEVAAAQQAALVATVVSGTTTIGGPPSPGAAITARGEVQPTAQPERATIAHATQPTAGPELAPIATVPVRPSLTPAPSPEARGIAAPAAATASTVLSSPIQSTSAPQVATLAPPSPAPPTSVPEPSPVPPTPAPIVQAAPTISSTGPADLGFVELYSGASIEGPILSERAQSLNGQHVVMLGYMAPPLKPDLDFFVLTKDPMVYCPFCSNASDWPFDIVFVRMGNGSVPPHAPTQAIRVVGTLSTGTATDAATGFVSQVRILADSVEVIQ